MTRPYISAGRAWSRRAPGPRSLTAAVTWADVVVASGGGYLNDTWWWHGFGVLSVLDLAQRLGKPTATFGQGLGPLTHPALRRQARRVLPRLHVLGLREGVTGQPLADALGVRADRVMVTGDDALGLVRNVRADMAGEPGSVSALGLNARVSGYAGVDQAVAGVVGQVLAEVVAQRRAAVVGLPVSRYERESDLSSIRSLWPGPLPAGERRPGPEDALRAGRRAAAGCRSRRDGQLPRCGLRLGRWGPDGLPEQLGVLQREVRRDPASFPLATEIVPLIAGDLARRLTEAVDRTWDADADVTSVNPRAGADPG